jgi:hypothetical protein
MPRDGSNVYHRPPGTDGVPDQTIASTKYNVFLADIEQDQNTPRPIVAGGTGATDARSATVALGGEVAKQIVTNFDSNPWVNGSFYSDVSATNPPVAGHKFAGFYTEFDSSNATVEARDLNDTSVPGKNYIRQKLAGVWGAWSADGRTIIGTNEGIGVTGGDMFFGVSGTSPSSSFIVNTKADVSGTNLLAITKAGAVTHNAPAATDTSLNLNAASGVAPANNIAGLKGGFQRWLMRLGNGSETGTANAGSNFDLQRYADGGTLLGTALSILRATGDALFGANVTATGIFSSIVKGNLFGNAGGTSAASTVAVTDANILLYNTSTANWAGIGTDGSGNVWVRVGTTGTPLPALYCNASDQTTVLGAAPPAADNSLRVPTTSWVRTYAQPANAQLFAGIPITSASGSYTTVATDAQKGIVGTAAGTITINSALYTAGTVISFAAYGANITISLNAGILYWCNAGTANSGNRTLANTGIATAIKLVDGNWIISGNGLT